MHVVMQTNDSGKMISNCGDHNHETTARQVQRHAIRANAKRKAATDIASGRTGSYVRGRTGPLKIISNESMLPEEEN